MVDASASSEETHAREAEQSRASLEQGGLPLQAQRRLEQERGGRCFSSDLSVDELLLARLQGYEAAGQVMGSSIYQVGVQYINYVAGELKTITQAHLHARELAMGRMQQEAAALGAHGVIGVRLTTRGYEWGPSLLEFTAVGTAVRLRGAAAPERPFLSDLSGEDFWTLLQAGYLPKGLAMGYCCYFVWGSRGNWGWQNQELTDFTAGVYQARALALQRLEAELPSLGASGVVGVQVQPEKRFFAADQGNPMRLQVDFLAIGTAIARAGPRVTPPTPRPVLNMTGLRPVRARLEGAELQRH